MVREARLRLTLSLLNNQQYQYEYRLLTASRTQPMRNILLFTLHECEEQAQPGKLAVDYDHLFRPLSEGGETLE